jgi:hypothetical protein
LRPMNVSVPGLVGSDFRLSFWWRNASYPHASQSLVGLFDAASQPFFVLSPGSELAVFVDRRRLVLSLAGDGSLLPADDAWHHLSLSYDSVALELALAVDGQTVWSSFLERLVGEPAVFTARVNGNWQELADIQLWQGYFGN